MKKKEIIETLIKRIAALERIVKSDSITLTDPENKNKKVVISITNGKFTQDIHSISSETKIDNITNQPI